MPSNLKMIGDIYGRLTVVSYAGKRGARRAWLCHCVCGNEHVATTSDLRYGSVQSCGCLLKGETAANVRHGHSGRNTPSPTYNSWRGMVERCSNPKQRHFKHYGGRGISVCKRWQVFENFLADMGERPVGRTIDRIDVDGNYEPGNCRWATNREQALNKQKRKSSIDADLTAETVTYRMRDGSEWVDGDGRTGRAA